MHHRHAFTIAEMFSAIIIIGLVLILVSAFAGCGLSSKEKNRLQMLNGTQLRMIHTGLVLYAQGNRDYYPGLDGLGREATEQWQALVKYHTQATGYDPVYRFAELLNRSYLKPEHLISPMDEKTKTPAQTGQAFSSSNFSYAMLRLNDNEAVGRRKEWRPTNGSRAAAASDRNLGPGAGAAAASNFGVFGETAWSGSVAYNDNSVRFQTNNVLQTQYNKKEELTADDLFADDQNTDGSSGNDAAMVYQDATTYVNQK